MQQMTTSVTEAAETDQIFREVILQANFYI